MQCAPFNTEPVGGGVGRGVRDDGGVIVGNRREGWRTGSGWPSSRARQRDRMAIDKEGGAKADCA